MTQPLAHPSGAALSAGGKSFPHAGLINFCLLDEQAVEIERSGYFRR